MPKAKQKTRGNPENSDEDMDYVPSQASQSSQSRVTMTQAEKSMATVSEADKKRRVNDLVQYLLLMDQKKMPIKRQDINQKVLKEMSRAFPVMMQRASQVLMKVFGYKLVEVEGKQKTYMLINTLETDPEEPHLEWSEEDNSRMGLVMVMLSVIFMSGNESLPEAIMWRALEHLGVQRDIRHEIFWDVKKFVTQDLVRQCYIEYVRVPNSDPPAYEFRWGDRAKVEISKRKILEFVSQMYEMEPASFKSQYQQVLEEENDNEDNGVEMVQR